MIFEGLVDESEVGKLKQGMELVLNVGALQGKPFKATLEYIAPKGVDRPGHDQVHDPRRGDARQGAVPALELLRQRRHRARPARECARDQRGRPHHRGQEDLRRSRRPTPQNFEKREIKTGLSDGINIEVVSGLQARRQDQAPLVAIDQGSASAIFTTRGPANAHSSVAQRRHCRSRHRRRAASTAAPRAGRPAGLRVRLLAAQCRATSTTPAGSTGRIAYSVAPLRVNRISLRASPGAGCSVSCSTSYFAR